MERLQFIGLEPVLRDSKNVVLVKELVGEVSVDFKPLTLRHPTLRC